MRLSPSAIGRIDGRNEVDWATPPCGCSIQLHAHVSAAPDTCWARKHQPKLISRDAFDVAIAPTTKLFGEDGFLMADNTEAERHFPTYRLGRAEIALKEYEFSAQLAANEERLFSNTSTIIALFAGVFASLTWGGLNRLFSGLSDAENRLFVANGICVAALALSYVAFSHLGNLRRSYVYASRKVIILRRMMGQSYGSSSLVLPSWRIEGADEPYAIKMFPGWRVRYAFPQYVIVAVTSLIIFTAVIVGYPDSVDFYFFRDISKELAFTLIAVPSFIIMIALIRRSMIDDNEVPTLFLARMIAYFLRVPLSKKYEYYLYRSRLARSELYRLGIDLTNLRNMAIFREDRTYFSHGGVAVQSTIRAARDYLVGRSSGGGSSIPQQLARSIFIVGLKSKLRRKVVEMFLAIWLSGRLGKAELLEVYLASVRYERNVIGVTAAMHHFFGGIIVEPSKAQSFVLIERLSNTRSLFRSLSVKSSLSSAVGHGVLDADDAKEVLSIYDGLLSEGLISLERSGQLPKDIAKELFR